jgi:hypothetical protein
MIQNCLPTGQGSLKRLLTPRPPIFQGRREVSAFRKVYHAQIGEPLTLSPPSGPNGLADTLVFTLHFIALIQMSKKNANKIG